MVGDEPLNEILDLHAQLMQLLAVLVQQQAGVAHGAALEETGSLGERQGAAEVALRPVRAKQNTGGGILQTLGPLVEASIAGGAVGEEGGLAWICLNGLAVSLSGFRKFSFTEKVVSFSL